MFRVIFPMADFIRKIKGLHAVSILWGLAVLYGAPAIAPAQQLGQ